MSSLGPKISLTNSFIAPLEKSGEDLSEYQPDLLVTLGGMIVSKKIKAFLRTHSPATHWHVDPKKAYDTFYCLSEHITSTPSAFFQSLKAEGKAYVQSSYCAHFLAQYNAHRLKVLDYLEDLPFSDLKAFELICKALPDNIHCTWPTVQPFAMRNCFRCLLPPTSIVTVELAE